MTKSIAKGLEMTNEDSLHRTWHLASSDADSSLTEFEFAILRFREAFEHWVKEAMRTTSGVDLTFAELVILHTLRMQARPTGGAGIARMLNRDDIPNIHYSLRKLAKMELISPIKEKGGKTLDYSVTPAGVEMTDTYAKLKQTVLLGQFQDLPGFDVKLANCTRVLSMLTGLYEESARIAATYSSASL